MMKGGQFCKLMDLIEGIRKVDAMILMHKGVAQNSLSVEQYEARKTKLTDRYVTLQFTVNRDLRKPKSFLNEPVLPRNLPFF